MPKLPRQPEKRQPRTLAEFTADAREMADSFPLIEATDAPEPLQAAAVAQRAEKLAARARADAAAKRDPYATEATRAAGIIATRGEDLGAEQVGKPVDPADAERLALLAIENGATPQGTPEWKLDPETKALGQAQLPSAREALTDPRHSNR